MHITILSVGKTKSSEYLALEDEYAKRIRGRVLLTRSVVKQTEQLLEKLPTLTGAVILLDEHGSTCSSREFASTLTQWSLQYKECTFVVGAADGIPPEARAYATDILALSEMTFPHELARVLLIEQLYRAQTILDNHPYHK